jgi:hypothetical protein
MNNLEFIQNLSKDKRKFAYFLCEQFCPNDGISCSEIGHPEQDCYNCIKEYLDSDWSLEDNWGDKFFEEIKDKLE